MKKPSLKRKKKPPPQLVTAQSPFEPIPVKTKRRELKKERMAKAKADKATTAQSPAPQPGKKPKGKRLGGLRGALDKPLRPLAKPLGRLTMLQGRTRIVVFGLLAIVVVIGLMVLTGGRDHEQQVREALTRYETASAKKDYQTLCDELLSKSYVRQTASSGLPCEVALRTALEDVRNPKLQVLSVKVDGDKADARVRGSAAGQVPGEDTYRLVHEDGSWRIQPPTSG